jgi:hypothetical protein
VRGVGRIAAGGALALLAALRPAAADPAGEAGAAWQLSLRSDRHSDALPLAALSDDDWRHLAPRAGHNLAYVDEQLRLQRRSGAWTFGLLARSQATLVASRETLLLAAQVDGGQRPAGETRWAADMRLRAFSGAGALVAHAWPLTQNLTLELSAQLLALGRWRERSIQGPVSYDASTASYAFALQSSELDDRLEFPFQQAFARRGVGTLLGAELAWSAGPWSAHAALRDGGWLHWRGLPQQQATLATDAQGLDADGFVVYRPLVEGRNAQAGLTRLQPWLGHLALSRTVAEGHQLGVTIDTVPGFGALPAVQWQQRLNPAAIGPVQLGLGWRLHERRATLALAWRGWQLQAGADRLDAAARSRELALSWQGAL